MHKTFGAFAALSLVIGCSSGSQDPAQLRPGASTASFAIEPSATNQRRPAVAFTGSGYLAVWEDARSGATDVYAARFGLAGERLDARAFGVATGSSHERDPAVACDGASCLVVWADQATGAIRGARISASGTVVDAAGLAISPAGRSAQRPAIAFDGASYLVVWEDDASDRLRAARVAPSGAVLDAVPFALAASAGEQSLPAVAFDGVSYLVVWEESGLTASSEVVAARVSPAGALLDAAPIRIATGDRQQTHPAVAFGGGTYLVAWNDAANGSPWDLRAVRVSPSGAVLGAPETVAQATLVAHTLPSIAFDGTSFVVAWEDQRGGVRDLYACEVSTSGVRAGADRALAATADAETWPALASDGADRALLVHELTSAATGTSQIAARPITMRATVEVSRSGRGTGAVVSSPDGISCGAACAFTFPGELSVTLTATPDTGFVFAGWTGACESAGTGPCTLDTWDDRSVTARFEYPPWSLSVRNSGYGRGTVTGAGLACTTGSSSGCSTLVPNTLPATVVTLVAEPDADSFPATWSGCATVEGNACTVVVSANRIVTATFQPRFWTVTGRTSGQGVGTISGAGMACSTGSTAGCTASVPNTNPPTDATFTATPSADSILTGWSGCASTAGDACTVSVSGPRSVTAIFQPKYWPLAVKTSGYGRGTVTGDGISCTTGGSTGCAASILNVTPATDVVLTATPDASSLVAGWSGCASTDGNTCTVSMAGARTVTAIFQPTTWALTAKTSGSGGGTITGGGIACTTGATAGCTAAIPNTTPETVVTLTATPNGASILTGWSGCASADGATCTVSMGGARTVTATFQPSTFPLTVKPTGSGAGTVTGGGISCTTGGTAGCTAAIPNTNPATEVTLTATPDASSLVASWSGCSSTAGNTCTVSVYTARLVTVTFQPTTWPLTVKTSGSGVGTVTGPGISCTTGSTAGCTAPVPNTTPATEVTLTAAPDARSIFVAWTGCASTAGNACTVSVSGARTVYATFQPSTWPLSVRTSGTGVGTVTGGGIACTSGVATGCTAAIPNTTPATDVVLTATPDASSIFAAWSGCASTSGNTCTVSMAGARTVYATFQPSTWPLTVKPNGTGTGAVTGGGIDCRSGSTTGCTAPIPNTSPATEVTLTAVADGNSVFASWSGCPSPSGNTCTVAVSSARTVYATFQPSTWTLTVRVNGSSTSSVTGPGVTCTAGTYPVCTATVPNTQPPTEITVTAVDGAGSVFTGWSGCANPVDRTCTVPMTGSSVVSAFFTAAP